MTMVSEDWIRAAEAAQLLKPMFKSEYIAQMTICKRAHNGLIRARAERFMVAKNKKESRDFGIPKDFWWAEGHGALHQNWAIGDFDTWVEMGNLDLQAFGVSFFRADIEKMIPPDIFAPSEPGPAPAAPSVGCRPPADWWESMDRNLPPTLRRRSEANETGRHRKRDVAVAQ